MQNQEEQTLYIYVVTEMSVDGYERDLLAPVEGYSSAAASAGKLGGSKRHLIAMFTEGAALLATMKALEEELILQAYRSLFIGIILFGAVFLALGVRRIRWLSIKLTS